VPVPGELGDRPGKAGGVIRIDRAWDSQTEQGQEDGPPQRRPGLLKTGQEEAKSGDSAGLGVFTHNSAKPRFWYPASGGRTPGLEVGPGEDRAGVLVSLAGSTCTISSLPRERASTAGNTWTPARSPRASYPAVVPRTCLFPLSAMLQGGGRKGITCLGVGAG
jgi:hypothetical protein